MQSIEQIRKGRKTAGFLRQRKEKEGCTKRPEGSDTGIIEEESYMGSSPYLSIR